MVFTGIINSIGVIADTTNHGQGDLSLSISAPGANLDEIKIGDSIAVAGVCLTVTAMDGQLFSADVSTETLDLTTLGMLGAGDAVNLELALKAGDALGGHLVSGHVDGRGQLVNRDSDARSERFEFEVSEHLSRYIAVKGSVCIDGISLTISARLVDSIQVSLIPHTVAQTTMATKRAGENVNIECDVLARYLRELMRAEDNSQSSDGNESLYARRMRDGF